MMMPLPGPEQGEAEAKKSRSQSRSIVRSIPAHRRPLQCLASLTNLHAILPVAVTASLLPSMDEQVRVECVHEQIAVLAGFIHMLEGGAAQMSEVRVGGLGRRGRGGRHDDGRGGGGGGDRTGTGSRGAHRGSVDLSDVRAQP